jgi:predicted GIY-YIG superfamily endonuclease
MTATRDNTQSLPQRAGVYIIRDADTPSITLYVGIATNLRSRLSSNHLILKHCRDRGINYFIDYELQPDESKRKKREHQLISELDAKLNDKGIQQSHSREKSTSQSSGTAWRDDIYSLAHQIKKEKVGISF